MSEKIILFLNLKTLPRDGSFQSVPISSLLRRGIPTRKHPWEEMATHSDVLGGVLSWPLGLEAGTLPAQQLCTPSWLSQGNKEEREI